MFRKAERKQAKLRLALCGPSGSGKTYSALLIAQGLAPGGKIALIDTERGSGELYADLTEYDVAPLEPPYTPARYIELIESAEEAGYDVLIIDSLSHAWTGEGGVLDMHDKAAAASRSGNSFAAWREVTPQHNQLVDAILGANLHIITTMRTKTAYDLVDDGRGKKKPVKIGLAPSATRWHGVRVHLGDGSEHRRARGHCLEGPYPAVRWPALRAAGIDRRGPARLVGRWRRSGGAQPQAVTPVQGPSVQARCCV